MSKSIPIASKRGARTPTAHGFSAALLLTLAASSTNAQAATNGYVVATSPAPTGSTADTDFTVTPAAATQLRLLAHYTPPGTSGFTTGAHVDLDGLPVIPTSVFATGTSGTAVLSLSAAAHTLSIAGTGAGERLTVEVVDDTQACIEFPLKNLVEAYTPISGQFPRSRNAGALPVLQIFNGTPTGTPSQSAEIIINGVTLLEPGAFFSPFAQQDMNSFWVGFSQAADPGSYYIQVIDRDVSAPGLTVNPPVAWTNQSSITLTGTSDDVSASVACNGPTTNVQADGTFSLFVSGLVEGDNALTVNAADSCNNTAAPVTVQVGRDNTAPTLTLVSPDPAAAVLGTLHTHQRPFELTVHYSDLFANGAAGSGVDTSQLVLVSGGTTYHPTLDAAASTATWSITLSDDAHQLFISAPDLVGNMAYLEVDVSVDATAPALAFSNPAADTTTQGGALPVFFTFTDSGTNASGMDLSTVHLYLSATPGATHPPDAAELTGLSMNSGAGWLTLDPSSLGDGDYYLNAVASDNFGNQGTATVHFTLARPPPPPPAPPVVSVTSPALDSNLSATVTAPHQAIAFSYSSTVGILTSGTAFSLNGSHWPACTAPLVEPPPDHCVNVYPDHATVSLTFQANGVYTLVATASDTSNATTSVTFTLHVQLPPPVLTVTLPTLDSSDQFLGHSQPQPIGFHYTSDLGVDLTRVHLSVDGTDVPLCTSLPPGHPADALCLEVASDEAGATVTFATDGAHALVASVADTAGQTSSKSFSITEDWHAPQVSFACRAAGCPSGTWNETADSRASASKSRGNPRGAH
jgi:hypothetical protein